jgi:hypothetical protein
MRARTGVIEFEVLGAAELVVRRQAPRVEDVVRRVGAARDGTDLSWDVGTCHYRPLQTLGTPKLLGT